MNSTSILKRRAVFLGCLIVFADTKPATAQRVSFEEQAIAYELETGVHSNNGMDDKEVFREWIELPGAPWILAAFGNYNLGDRSYVEFVSNATGEVQRMDRTGAMEWNRHSAKIPGDLIEMTLVVAPGETNVFFAIDHLVTTARYNEPAEVSGGVASICGDFDNRVSSSDPRVGRINGCTAWLVSTGVVLTAGHCTNSSGDITGVMEFNVPMSNNNGETNTSPLADQYPVIANSTSFRDNGVGDDWAIFRIGSAADGSGRNAFISQGFFRMSLAVPPEDATMRVTGYGLDNRPAGNGASGATCCDTDSDDVCDFDCNSSSRTSQTSTGRFDELSGDTLEYEVDTMPGNSGGPVIRESNGVAVGIHTAGGCGDVWVGDENHGTSFGRASLSSALNAYLGPNTVFVDDSYVFHLELGTALMPARTIVEGAALASSGDTLLFGSGNYSESEGNTGIFGIDGKSLRLTTNTGTAIIGN